MALANQWPIHGHGLQVLMEAGHNLAAVGKSAACFLVDRLNLGPSAERSAGSLWGTYDAQFLRVGIRLKIMPWELRDWCHCEPPILRATAKRLLLVVVTRETAAENRSLVITSLSCVASRAWGLAKPWLLVVAWQSLNWSRCRPSHGGVRLHVRVVVGVLRSIRS